MGLTGPELKRALTVAGVNANGTDDAFEQLANCFQEINAWQKNSYEAAWKAVLQKFETVRRDAAGIVEVLNVMDAPPQSDGLINATLGSAKHPLRIEHAGFENKPGHTVVVRDGEYVQLSRESTRETILKDILYSIVTPSTNAVVELGCGWGRNLAALAVALGCEDLVFIGAEQSENGRACTKALLELDGRVQAEVHAFDFYEPDLSFLAGHEEIVIFSCAAIEQIAFLPVGFVETLLNSAKKVRLVFFEPFAWQIQEEFARAIVHRCIVNARDQSSFSSLTRDYVFQLSNDHMDRNSAIWALSCCYNMNLYSLLSHAESQGHAKLKSLTLNVEGNNLFNPYSAAILERSDS